MKFTNAFSAMNIFAFFLTIFAVLGSFVVEAAPTVELKKRDVYVPHITSPTAGDVWTSGQQAEVTWGTSDAPEHITNPNGVILLRKGERTTPVVLASGFSILDGNVSFPVPTVVTGDDYSIVLFGDSGNTSPNITINGFTW